MFASRSAFIGAWIFIGIGAVLRVDAYLRPRSLWLDEAFVAVNIARPWRTLLAPQDYGVLTPPGFLATARLFTTLFGAGDAVLLLVPLLTGLASLVLFHRLARATVPGFPAWFALLMFAVSPVMVRYSAEFKQYASDAAIAMTLSLMALKFGAEALTRRRVVALAVTGAAAVWFSHPAAFVLAAVWGYLLWPAGGTRVRPPLIACGVIGGAWLASFAVMYRVSLAGQNATPVGQSRVRFWQGDFMPSPFDGELPGWLYTHYFRAFGAVGVATAELAAVIFIVGAIAMFARRGRLGLLLMGPPLLALVASHFTLYAFAGRLLVFAAPSIYIVLVHGVQQIRLRPSPARLVVHAFVIACFLSYPLHARAPEPYLQQDMTAVLRYIADHRRAGDVLYVGYWAEPAFRHYHRDFGFDYDACQVVAAPPAQSIVREIQHFHRLRGMTPTNARDVRCVVAAHESWPVAHAELEHLRGRGRVWLVLTYVRREEIERAVAYLDATGVRRNAVVAAGVVGYLYER